MANEMMDARKPECWACGGHDLQLVKAGNIAGSLQASSVKISSMDYGCTADMYRCGECGFLQCHSLGNDVLDLYQDMDDAEYETTRAERTVQANRLVDQAARFKPGGRLLDVGAGSGILVAAAIERGYEAVGVEPSGPLQTRAEQLRLPVVRGVLPHPEIKASFDVVTVIDVIEHVPDPVELARAVADVMADDGICIMVTPDVGSFAARVMGHRWWHYRIAHIGYFNKSTFTRVMKRAGLRPIEFRRPSWHFPASYLMTRALAYFPPWARMPVPGFLDRIVVPLNLFDSYMIVLEKEGHGHGA